MRKTHIQWQHLVRKQLLAAAATTLITAPFLTTIALAKPPAHAPAHGYYKNKGQKKVKKVGDRNDNDRKVNVSVIGVVTRDLEGDRFTIRTDKGFNYTVVAQGQEPRSLNRGDRVEVRGLLNRNTMMVRASNVRILSNNDGDDFNGRVTLTGIVTRDLSGDRFEMRASNGRTYIVQANNEPNSLSRGDRISVRGFLRNGVFRAETVRITG